MNNEALEDFEVLLNIRLKELLCGRYGLITSIGDTGSAIDPMDAADLASSHCDMEISHIIHHHHRKLVEEIRAAIKRIKDGEFGICEECSGPIGLARLRAQPTSMLCITCKREQELERRLNAA